MFNNLQKKSGFSLIEVMVAISILLVMSFISSDYVKTVFRSSKFNDEQQTAIHNARRAIGIMNKEVRGANSSEMGDYTLFNINDDDFGFYSDIDNDGETEKIRYYLDNINYKLLKSVTEPGLPGNYSETEKITTIANFVNNREEAIFLYYDGTGTETNTINEIRLIKTILKVNVTPWRSPNDYYVESSINLRNLKDNL
jgi:prepilin-type N-terminal cleavage/methylation domain-containing protein